AIKRQVLIQPPTARAMVDNDAADRVPPQRIIPAFQVAAPEAQVAQDHIVGIDLGGFAADANPIAWSRLPGNGHEGLVDRQPVGQGDDAGDAKNDDPRTARCQSFTQAAGSPIRQGGDFVNLSPPSYRYGDH